MAEGGVLNEPGDGWRLLRGRTNAARREEGNDSAGVVLLWKSMAAALYHIEGNTFLLSAAHL